MEEQTTISVKAPKDDSTKKSESQLMNVSMRGWITLIVVICVCGMEWFKIGVTEPLYSMTLIIVGFYFGQKQSITTPPTRQQITMQGSPISNLGSQSNQPPSGNMIPQ